MTSSIPPQRNIDGPLGWVRRWATDDPDRVAIVTPDGHLTYQGLEEMVAIRAGVLNASTEPGSVVPVRVDLGVPGVVDILALVALGAVPLPYADDEPHSHAEAVPGDHICIATSGSSGEPQIVRITATNIVAAVESSRSRLGTGPDDRWLLCLPIHHVGGLSILWRSFEAGGSVAVAPFDMDLPKFIEVSRPTIASMVPTMVYRMLRTRPDALVAIERIIVGGAKLDPDLLRRAHDASVTLVTTYGATEATSQIATGAPSADAPDRVGKPLDGFEVAVLDGDGASVVRGRRGRISIDGPAVSPGYLGEAPRRGHFVTGDIGSLDDEGVLYVHGRADDMITTGGENVFLGVVADAVRATDGVDDAFACGVPDIEWGTAIVMVYEGPRSPGAIESELREHLPPHAIPKRWVRVDDLPRLANHKHDRQAIQTLADEAGEDRGQRTED